MTVKVADIYAEVASALDLRPQLSLYFVALCLAGHFRRVAGKISLRIQQAGNLILGRDRTPAESRPLAGEGLVNAQVRVRMRLGEICGFEEPGAGDQDACGSNPVMFECFRSRAVDRVIHAEIIRVQDQQTRQGRIAEPFLDRLRGSLGSHWQ